MSVDIDIGGADFTLTYNYAYMYIRDDVNQIRDLDGMKAYRARLRLKWLRTYVEENYFLCVEGEEENCKGWGSVDRYHQILNEMILQCSKEPESVVSVL